VGEGTEHTHKLELSGGGLEQPKDIIGQTQLVMQVACSIVLAIINGYEHYEVTYRIEIEKLCMFRNERI
jgi:hypothetical protein